MKVKNMISVESGKTLVNQFMIKDNSGSRYFQSYDKIIIQINILGQVFLDENYYNHSATTSKYRNMFLDETTKEIEEKIKSGKYILMDLNEDWI